MTKVKSEISRIMEDVPNGKLSINHLYLFPDKPLSEMLHHHFRHGSWMEGWSDEKLSYDNNKRMYVIRALPDLSFCSASNVENYRRAYVAKYFYYVSVLHVAGQIETHTRRLVWNRD